MVLIQLLSFQGTVKRYGQEGDGEILVLTMICFLIIISALEAKTISFNATFTFLGSDR